MEWVRVRGSISSIGVAGILLGFLELAGATVQFEGLRIEPHPHDEQKVLVLVDAMIEDVLGSNGLEPVGPMPVAGS